MAYPVFSKTWQYNANNSIAAQGSTSADNAQMTYAIFHALISFGSTPMTVDYSCDGTTAGTKGDAVFRWTSGASIVCASAGSAHSWIVLKAPGIVSGGEFLFTWNTFVATRSQWQVSYSPSVGFTGGSTTADPTASDAQVFQVSGSYYSSLISDLTTRWSVEMSSDGQCINAFAFAGGNLIFGMLIHLWANPTTGLTNPIYFFCPSNTVNNAQLAAANLGVSALGLANLNGTKSAISMTVAGILGTNTNCLPAQQTVVNGVSGNWPAFPLGAYSTTVGKVGEMGTFQDLWANSSSIATGDTAIDATNSRQWIMVGALAFPWPYGQAINLS
jgi:hypothetical protein